MVGGAAAYSGGQVWIGANHVAAREGTVEFVNRFSGDPSHTPNPVLGPITEAPFHGMRLMFLGTAIGSSGVLADAEARVLSDDGGVIPGLYAIGSCAATTRFGSGYNSGMALSRGLTHAYLVAQELGEPVAGVADREPA